MEVQRKWPASPELERGEPTLSGGGMLACRAHTDALEQNAIWSDADTLTLSQMAV